MERDLDLRGTPCICLRDSSGLGENVVGFKAGLTPGSHSLHLVIGQSCKAVFAGVVLAFTIPNGYLCFRRT